MVSPTRDAVSISKKKRDERNRTADRGGGGKYNLEAEKNIG